MRSGLSYAGRDMTTQTTDHRDFVSGLSAGDRRHLTERSDTAGLTALALHWGAILLTGGLILISPPGWPFLLLALMLVQGILIIFLFTLLHETVHRTPFRTVWLNHTVGYVCGFLVFLAPVWFRYFHLAHHRHTQDPAHDPELAAPRPRTWREYVAHISGLPVWRFQLGVLLRNARGQGDENFVPANARGRIRHEARAMLAVYGALVVLSAAAGSAVLIYVWIVPVLLGQPFLRLYLLAEHGRCPQVANMFENTRTTFTNQLIRRLAWNMPYHAEHHAFPTVPFHRLPELHEVARQHLRVTENGYARFTRAYQKSLSQSPR